jgi:thimet oligopeptidase
MKLIIPLLKTIDDIKKVFPDCVVDLRSFIHNAVLTLTNDIHEVYKLDVSRMSFANTMLVLDTVQVSITYLRSMLYTIDMVYPDDSMRKAAHAEFIIIDELQETVIDYNTKLYEIVKTYIDRVSLRESLDQKQKDFIKQTMSNWESNGLHLPEAKRQRLRDIKVELDKHAEAFSHNITFDPHKLHFKREHLIGVPDDYIKDLPKAPDGTLVAFPDPFIIETCSHEHTRMECWRMVVNRGYPANHQELERIIALRDELAQLLGFTSFADLDIKGQMAQSVAHVEHFLTSLIKQCQTKLPDEVAFFKAHMPSDVSLTSEGQIKSWDIVYIKNNIEKTVFKSDQALIAQYFPTSHTIDALLDLAQKFFNVTFKQHTVTSLWVPDLVVIEVYNGTDLKGFIVLDIFARKHKYPYILEQPIIPSFKYQDTNFPGLTVVTTSFPYETDREPSLLRFADVVLFFHEFGHALHTILAGQPIASFAGSQVTRDFVEVPSQMVEQWLWESTILKRIGKHYKTGEPLSDELIKGIVSLKKFDSADITLEQCYYSMLSLEYFKEGTHKDIGGISKRLFQEIRPHIAFSPNDHSYAAFDHLIAYGAKYYSYLWARVYAIDLFYSIKKYIADDKMLENIGKRYVQEIITPGGSESPLVLLKRFLGREPNGQAFFNDLGMVNVDYIPGIDD